MFSSSHIFALALSFPLLAICSPIDSRQDSLPPPLDSNIVNLVRQNAITISTHSWEIGTLAEALTEYEWCTRSVFADYTLYPPPALIQNEAADVLSIAETIVNNIPSGQLTLMPDGAVGDPSSIGVAVLLRNWTLPPGQNDAYDTAAKNQLNYLLNVAPRASNGAISQRASEVQLWADFIYMAPPFIAYYGALEGGDEGAALLQTAYEQVKLYRDVLFDADVGLWRHVELGSWSDHTHWGTGNAWAAAGALRVLATIQGSDAADSMQSQHDDLLQWVKETLDGVWKYQQANGTLLNYLDQPGSFADTSSTALLAASTFRYATITGDETHITAAISALTLIRSSIDSQGWLQNTVNPESFSTPSGPGEHSPEGQSFVLLLEAAAGRWGSVQDRH